MGSNPATPTIFPAIGNGLSTRWRFAIRRVAFLTHWTSCGCSARLSHRAAEEELGHARIVQDIARRTMHSCLTQFQHQPVV